MATKNTGSEHMAILPGLQHNSNVVNLHVHRVIDCYMHNENIGCGMVKV